jgi:hypothetical protein
MQNPKEKRERRATASPLESRPVGCFPSLEKQVLMVL